MLKMILSVSGKPGLYKMISQGKNILIIESLIDNKRIPAYAKDKVISLGDIAIYTNDAEVPLHEVLNSVKAKEESKAASLDLGKATTDDLRAYLESILPDFDKERVYPSDIKRLLSWYNILLNAGITDFDPKDEKKEAEGETSAEAKEEVKKTAKSAKPSASKSTVSAAKKTSTAAPKKPAGKPAQRTPGRNKV